MDIGKIYTVEKIVQHADSAAALGGGSVDVFATPAMILIMEEAARLVVQNELPEGHTTVGTVVNIKHLAATPVGKKVNATAKLTFVDGRRLVFEVEAADENGIIGKGTHERAIIDIKRFMAKL